MKSLVLVALSLVAVSTVNATQIEIPMQRVARGKSFLEVAREAAEKSQSGILQRQMQIREARQKLTTPTGIPIDVVRRQLQGIQSQGLRLQLAGGTDIGGGLTSSVINPAWCRTQVSLLEMYKEEAEATLEETSDYFETNKILVTGMVEAIVADQSVEEETFTKKALARGVEIASLVGALDKSKTSRDMEVIHNFLTSYYNFVITKASRGLDLPIYIPYVNSWHNGQTQFDIGQFERKFVEFAAEQLAWINRSLAQSRFVHGEQVVTVKGTEVYLSAAQVLSLYAANDLANSLWANRFACAIDSLLILNERLEQRNAGNATGTASNIKSFIKRTYNKLNEIVGQIRADDSCQ